MKTILVSIDLTVASENAMLYAGKFARGTNSSIILLHTYQIPVSLNDAPILMIPEEEIKKSVDENLDRAKELINKNYPGISIHTESRLGDEIDELNDVCSTYNPFVIIIGKHSSKGVERFVFGDADMAIIRHASVPVIAVPDDFPIRDIKNIGFASDGSEKTGHLEKIREVVSLLGSKLHCIHVKTSDDEPDINLNNILPELQPQCETIKDENFSHAMQSFLSSHQLDLLILIPHKHNLVERLFFKIHTASILHTLNIPVMCIPF
ncbi:MAG: universal stress protein [Flavisolibacter sp.]